MSSSIRRSARRALLALAVALGPTAAVAQSADAPADSGSADGLVQEIIIDDSGIILKEGDHEVQLPGEEDGKRRLHVRVDTTTRDEETFATDDEQVTFGRDVTVESDEIVHNDLVILFGDLEIYGEVVGNIVVVMGDVYVHDGAVVTGDVLVVGGEVEREEGARIVGEVTRTSSRLGHLFTDDWRARDLSWLHRERYGAGGAVLKLVEFLVLALAGSLLLAPRLPRLTAGLRRKPGKSILLGVLSLLAALLLVVPAALLLILLLLTVVGIPVAVLVVLALVGVGFVAWLIPLYTFSRYTFEARGMNRYLSVTLWAGIYWLLHMLGAGLGPVGGLVTTIEAVAWLFGLGALVLTRLGSRHVLADPS